MFTRLLTEPKFAIQTGQPLKDRTNQLPTYVRGSPKNFRVALQSTFSTAREAISVADNRLLTSPALCCPFFDNNAAWRTSLLRLLPSCSALTVWLLQPRKCRFETRLSCTDSLSKLLELFWIDDSLLRQKSSAVVLRRCQLTRCYMAIPGIACNVRSPILLTYIFLQPTKCALRSLLILDDETILLRHPS
jgi:hypothetical protein